MKQVTIKSITKCIHRESSRIARPIKFHQLSTLSINGILKFPLCNHDWFISLLIMQSKLITHMKQQAAILQVSTRRKRISKPQRVQNLVQINEISLLIWLMVINQVELEHLRIYYCPVFHHHIINDQISKSSSIRRSTQIQALAEKVISARNWIGGRLKVQVTGQVYNCQLLQQSKCKTKSKHLLCSLKMRSS